MVWYDPSIYIEKLCTRHPVQHTITTFHTKRPYHHVYGKNVIGPMEPSNRTGLWF